MPSPLYNAFGGGMPNNPMFSNLMQRFNQFKRTFSGNPRDQVQQMLNSGQMSQSQFNQLKQMAEQMQRFLR